MGAIVPIVVIDYYSVAHGEENKKKIFSCPIR